MKKKIIWRKQIKLYFYGIWINLIILLDCPLPDQISQRRLLFLMQFESKRTKMIIWKSEKWIFCMNRCQINFPNSILSPSILDHWRYFGDHQNANLLNFVLLFWKNIIKKEFVVEYTKFEEFMCLPTV